MCVVPGVGVGVRVVEGVAVEELSADSGIGFVLGLALVLDVDRGSLGVNKGGRSVRGDGAKVECWCRGGWRKGEWFGSVDCSSDRC